MSSPAEVLVVSTPALCRSKACAGKGIAASSRSMHDWPLCDRCLNTRDDVDRRWHRGKQR